MEADTVVDTSTLLDVSEPLGRAVVGGLSIRRWSTYGACVDFCHSHSGMGAPVACHGQDM